MATLHGELYLDENKKPHFMCHTPAGMTFTELRDHLLQFIALLQSQYDRQEECPYHEKDNAETYPGPDCITA